MHTTYTRINNVTSFISSCMIGLLVAIAVSSLVFKDNAKGELLVIGVQVLPGKGRNMRKYGPKQEFAFVNFNLTADLSPLFNWNTKQLFLYVSAEYTDTHGTSSEVVIWDRIVRRKEAANISSTFRNKYHFREMSTTFRDVPPAYYALKYNVMPYVGLLTYGEAARTKKPIPFPEPHQLA